MMRNIEKARADRARKMSEARKAWWANKTPEQRSQIWRTRARKAWATKRAKRG